jgi:hypothetical protein
MPDASAGRKRQICGIPSSSIDDAAIWQFRRKSRRLADEWNVVDAPFQRWERLLACSRPEQTEAIAG